MQTNISQISAKDSLFFFNERESSFIVNNQGLQLDRLPGFESADTNYKSEYLLCNNDIFIIKSSGSPSPYDLRVAADRILEIFRKRKIEKVHAIWDLLHLTKASIKIRKAIIETNIKLAPYIKSRQIIVTPKYKTLVKVYKFIYRNQVQKLCFADSIEHAIHAILQNKFEEEKTDLNSSAALPDRELLLLKSKEELVDMMVDYSQKHEQSTNKVLQALGQISWGGRFNRVEINIGEEEPHFELVNAFSLLQQDVEEIIREYKELNQNLELKVAERIVDFIDKESNLRSILDNSDRVTWLMNSQLELIDFNAAFTNEIKRRYKTTPSINKPVLSFIKDEKEKQVWKERFETTLAGKSGIYLDQDSFNGQERVLEIKTYPINEIGKIKGVAVFIEDITQLKHSQLKLIEKNRDLQKVNSELDSFVYRVSHDLRAPLTSILGLINLMKIEDNPDKLREYIGLQEKSIFKLDLFIKEIINLSRNSRLGIVVSKIEFQSLIGDVLESQHYTKEAEKIQCNVEIEENISFYTDQQRLSIILHNLVSNALKYYDLGKKDPKVNIKVQSVDNDCMIEVQDNGIGISDLYLPKIFDMFFRATEEFSGSGLGLYIVKETVEKLSGKITVKTKMRQGSTFRVVLPNLKDRLDTIQNIEE